MGAIKFSLQVLEREQIMSRLQEVTSQLECALSGISFEKLDISDEIQEQVRGYLIQCLCFLFFVNN